MKSLLIAGGLLLAGITSASAQYATYSRGAFPYAQKYHTVCQEKAHRLHDYEKRAASGGSGSSRDDFAGTVEPQEGAVAEKDSDPERGAAPGMGERGDLSGGLLPCNLLSRDIGRRHATLEVATVCFEDRELALARRQIVETDRLTE